MKIGPIDISIPMIVYASVLVVGGGSMMTLFNANKDIRAESYFRKDIYRAMYDDDRLDVGISACNNLIAIRDKPNAHLFLGVLLTRQDKFSEAKKAFQDVQNFTNASPEEKYWALICEGVAGFNEAGTNEARRKEAAVKAEKLFQQALQLNSKEPDAIIDLALARLWQNSTDKKFWDDAQKDCQSALALPNGASIKADAQLYYLLAQIYQRQSRSRESLAAFENAHLARPTFTKSIEARRAAMLLTLVYPDIEPGVRRIMLNKGESEIQTFPPNIKILGLNALGIGWKLLKTSDATVGAQKNFLSAIQFDSRDPLAYLNLCALYEDQISEISSKLTVPVTGLNGETPIPNPWVVVKTKPPTAEDSVGVSDIRELLIKKDTLWTDYLNKVNLKTAEKVDAKLRHVADLRRMSFIVRNPAEKLTLGNRIVAIANELIALDAGNPEVQYEWGLVALERGDYLAALKAFRDAHDKGLKNPALDALLEQLSRKPAILDVRPDASGRWFGVRPLVSEAIKIVSSGGAIKKATMKISGRPVEAVLSGTQVIYLPAEGELNDGKQDVELSVVDASDNQIDLPPFSFDVDRTPPTVSIAPEKETSADAGWTLTLSDRSGIDYSTLTVSLKSTTNTRAPLKELVKSGKYRVMMQPLKIKPGDAVTTESVKLLGLVGLQPGEYTMLISVKDLAGNPLVASRIFNVK